MKEKYGLPVLLMFIFAVTRLPGMMPLNFSAAIALMFCAGVYLPRHLAWWLPLCAVLITDVLLNLFYYDAAPLNAYGLVNYAAFLGVIWLGRQFSARSSWLSLLGGGLMGAVVFYLVTNTASWIQNPGYVKSLGGWIQALTSGIPGYPPTWTFFRNTLLSGGLFTGLFVAAMKFSQASETEEEKTPEEAAADDPQAGDASPEESKP